MSFCFVLFLSPQTVSSLLMSLFFYYIHYWEWECATVHVRSSEDNLQESALSSTVGQQGALKQAALANSLVQTARRSSLPSPEIPTSGVAGGHSFSTVEFPDQRPGMQVGVSRNASHTAVRSSLARPPAPMCADGSRHRRWWLPGL